MKHIPSFLKTLGAFVLSVWLILGIARLIFGVILWPSIANIELGVILQAFYTGLKFDGRMAVFMSIPLAFALILPFLEKNLGKLPSLLPSFYALLFFALGLLYTLDFGFYFYLRQRLDSTLLDLLAETSLSLTMVLETYPVFWIGLGVSLFAYLGFFMTKKLLHSHTHQKLGWKKRTSWGFLGFILLFLIAYAQISSNLFPLRWSNAYFHTSPNIPLLALNPVQNLYDSLRSRRAIQPDLQAVKEAYPRMKAWLGVPEAAPELSFLRTEVANPQEPPLNFVIIIMESLGTPRTSLWQGLDTNITHDPTPNLRKLAKKSMYFPWFFAPARTTARAVFTFVTGIPDVNRTTGTSSRNPALVDQFSVLSEFENYGISYMLGGSANWANIRGVLLHNIPNLRLLEEGYWKSQNIDVWGISDLDLFREGVDFLNQEKQPFISVIQTAAFHRPWTIPKDNAGFVSETVPDEILSYYGFDALEEYNSLRFSDHALAEFFELAKDQPWFNNTVFAIFGDHGLTARSTNATASYLASNLQGSHVPLLLYAPGRPDLFAVGENPMVAGNVDVLPTLAKMAGIAFRNQTLGRDLLDPHTQATARQFIAGDDEAFRRLVEDGYCYVLTQTEALYRLDDNTGTNLLEQEPERAERMRQFAKDAFITSKFMLFNNQKKKMPPKD